MVQFRLENPLKFGSDLWDPSHRFETSWLLPPYVLGAIRATFGFYGLLVNLIQIGYYCTHPVTFGGCAVSADEFSYFTVLTYYGLAFYNLTAGLHTLTYARTGTPLIDRFPRPLQALHAFYYTTITVYPFIVTAVYWGVIFPGTWFTHEFDAFSNTSQHALNSFFALFEIIVPRTPAPLWIHAWWLIVVLALYLSLAYVTYYTKGFYPYSFLDIQSQGSGKVAIYIICIAAAAVVLFSIVKGVIHLRLWLTERKGGMDGRFVGVSLGSRGHDGSGGVRRTDEDEDLEMATGAGKSERTASALSGTNPHHL